MHKSLGCSCNWGCPRGLNPATKNTELLKYLCSVTVLKVNALKLHIFINNLPFLKRSFYVQICTFNLLRITFRS